jgi:hypothetical protein
MRVKISEIGDKSASLEKENERLQRELSLLKKEVEKDCLSIDLVSSLFCVY